MLRRAHDAKWIEKLEAEGLQAFLAAWSKQPLFATQRRAPEERRTRQDTARRVHTAAGLADSLRVLGLAAMPDHGSQVHCLRCPITFLAGDLDDKFSALATHAASLVPLGKCVLASGFGHNLLLEAPEIVAEAISELLSLPPGERP